MLDLSGMDAGLSVGVGVIGADAATQAISEKEVNHNNIMIDQKDNTQAIQGTSRTYALRRLRKDRPDLHERVINGVMTPHGAMIEAGFRRQPITIPRDVEKAAQKLREVFTEDEIDMLVMHLQY